MNLRILDRIRGFGRQRAQLELHQLRLELEVLRARVTELERRLVWFNG